MVSCNKVTPWVTSLLLVPIWVSVARPILGRQSSGSEQVRARITATIHTIFRIISNKLLGLSFAAGFARICFPESRQFIEAKKAGHKHISAGAFWVETKMMMKKEWKMVVYCIILMTWFNYYSHTSQDSYTTFMLTGKALDNSQASRASIIMKVGACVGGTIIGYLSQFYGRRRSMIIAALISGIIIPAWILPEGEASLSASGFFMQFFVQGAWGVIPIHLNELSPPAFRSSFPGVVYQIGNMISSPSAQIVNALAEEHYTIHDVNGKVSPFNPFSPHCQRLTLPRLLQLMAQSWVLLPPSSLWASSSLS